MVPFCLLWLLLTPYFFSVSVLRVSSRLVEETGEKIARGRIIKGECE